MELIGRALRLALAIVDMRHSLTPQPNRGDKEPMRSQYERYNDIKVVQVHSLITEAHAPNLLLYRKPWTCMCAECSSTIDLLTTNIVLAFDNQQAGVGICPSTRGVRTNYC